MSKVITKLELRSPWRAEQASQEAPREGCEGGVGASSACGGDKSPRPSHAHTYGQMQTLHGGCRK